MSYLLNSFILLASRIHKLRNIPKYFHGHFNNKIILFRIMSAQCVSMCEHFKGRQDRYKGVIVDSQEEGCSDITEFSKKLDDSLKIWTENEFRGIWFKVHLNQSDWVPVLTKKGFKYHHANEEYVMLYKWLPKIENSNIPPYAHTMLGVGAVVINDKNEVLIVQEKHSFSNIFHYKLPGGYVEPGENIVDAAIREVHEETNIRTEFQSVLTLRHSHGSINNCSDIYIVVHLKALTYDIVKCEREIAEAKWIDIKEFLNHPEITQLNKFFIRKYLEYKDRGIKINWIHGINEVLNKPYTMYSVTKSDNNLNVTDLESLKNKK